MPNPFARYNRLAEPRPSLWWYLIQSAWNERHTALRQNAFLLSLGLMGFGVIFLCWPEQTVEHGFRHLRNIISPFGVAVFMLGLIQFVVNFLEWETVNKAAAFVGFFIYAGFAANHETHAGQWMYSVAALSEAVLVLADRRSGWNAS